MLVCRVLAASDVADSLSAAFICGLPGFALPIASSLSPPVLQLPKSKSMYCCIGVTVWHPPLLACWTLYLLKRSMFCLDPHGRTYSTSAGILEDKTSSNGPNLFPGVDARERCGKGADGAEAGAGANGGPGGKHSRRRADTRPAACAHPNAGRCRQRICRLPGRHRRVGVPQRPLLQSRPSLRPGLITTQIPA